MAIINKDFQGRPDRSKRLPPGQSKVTSWPVLTYGPTPDIDLAAWTLTIDGEVNEPATFNWNSLRRSPLLP